MRPAPFFLAVAAISATAAAPAAAQAPAPPSSAAPSPAAVAAAQNIRDLSLLNALLPLQLTREQIDALLPVLREATKLDAERRKQDEDALKALAADVAKARDAALGGEKPAKELEDRVAAMGKESTARLAAARKEAVEKLMPVVKAFTDAQREEIDEQSRAFFGGRRVPARYRRDPSKAPMEAVQELALRAFIEGVLLDERAPSLLARLKPAAGADTSSAAAATSAPAPAAAAPPAANP